MTFCTASCILNSCHFFVCLSLLPWIIEYIVLYHHSPWGCSFVGLHQISLLFFFFCFTHFSGLDFHSIQAALVRNKKHQSGELIHLEFFVNLSFSRSKASQKQTGRIAREVCEMYMSSTWFNLFSSSPAFFLACTVSTSHSWMNKSGMKICSLFFHMGTKELPPFHPNF